MARMVLLTLNCFGVPAPLTDQRLLQLSAELNRCQASVVCLQEVQLHRYRRLLIGACSAYPAHASAPHLHAPRGGLLTLGAQPLTESQFTLYEPRGLWYTPALADWILYKGILQTTLWCDGLRVRILNTHLNANYSGNWSRSNIYAAMEWRQLAQLAEVVRRQPADALVLVAGDFNIPRGSWMYEEFLALSGLHDPLSGDARPTYRIPGVMPRRYLHAIDYALVRAPALAALQIQSDLCFSERYVLPGGSRAYLSDHLGVWLAISW